MTMHQANTFYSHKK